MPPQTQPTVKRNPYDGGSEPATPMQQRDTANPDRFAGAEFSAKERIDMKLDDLQRQMESLMILRAMLPTTMTPRQNEAVINSMRFVL